MNMPDHAQRDLRHLVVVRVVHERARVPERELVDERLAGRDRALVEARRRRPCRSAGSCRASARWSARAGGWSRRCARDRPRPPRSSGPACRRCSPSTRARSPGANSCSNLARSGDRPSRRRQSPRQASMPLGVTTAGCRRGRGDATRGDVEHRGGRGAGSPPRARGTSCADAWCRARQRAPRPRPRRPSEETIDAPSQCPPADARPPRRSMPVVRPRRRCDAPPREQRVDRGARRSSSRAARRSTSSSDVELLAQRGDELEDADLHRVVLEQRLLERRAARAGTMTSVYWRARSVRGRRAGCACLARRRADVDRQRPRSAPSARRTRPRERPWCPRCDRRAGSRCSRPRPSPTSVRPARRARRW